MTFPSSGGGLGQGSSSSAGPADEDVTGFFRTLPRGKKCAVGVRTRVRGCPPVSAHPRWRLSPDSWWESLTPAQQAEMEEARAAVWGQEEAEEEEEKEDEAVTFLIWVSGGCLRSTLLSALLGSTVDTCTYVRLRWFFFRARVSGSHLFGVGLA